MPGHIMAIKAIQGSIYGGAALKRHLGDIERRLGRGAHARVGFLADAVYPANEETDGKVLHVAQVAFWNHYGTNPKKGPKIPARPFFTTMIEKKSSRWGYTLGIILRQTNYDAELALTGMAQIIQGDLRESIEDWTTPPNAPRTAAKPPVGKGFNKPLTDTGWMKRSVDYQVLAGDGTQADD